MDSWIDLHALWKIVVIGLAAGAGLPALFAIGLRVLAPPRHDAHRVEPGTGTITMAPANVAAASVCFAVVLAAIGYGIYLIVAGS
ncbi:MAG TPA: hypothetical protein VHW92_12625 [Mycobacteriales bacterium]|nr:hypothetical protein [Mycobacteriales bacterium]